MKSNVYHDPRWRVERDARWLALARFVSAWSPDRQTKVGCVIANGGSLLAIGWNDFPIGVEPTEERLERSKKTDYMVHAELNAIYDAARRGVPLQMATIYLPWYPCLDCARAIVQSCICTLVAIEPDWNHERWGASFRRAREIFEEAGTDVVFHAERA